MTSRYARTLKAALLLSVVAVAVPVFARAAPSGESAFHFGPIRKASPAPAALGQTHLVFGEIVKLTNPTFTMRLRGRRTIVVDATSALATGKYSAPLFAGKLVTVQGKIDARGIIHADTITRITHIDATTAQDR